MSNKFLCSSSVILAAAIATTAWAQTPTQPAAPDRTSPRTERPDGATVPPSTTTRSAMSDAAAKARTITPQSFVAQTAVIGKAEIELGKLALKNSKDASVQEFAQRMITDHINADQQLKSVAAKHGLNLPQQLDPEHQALKEKLTNLKGADFDREYTKAMIGGHEKAVALFEAASQNAQMPADLKQFTSDTLPALKAHRDMAHSLEGKSDIQHASDHATRS
jgi:putative membrane protein